MKYKYINDYFRNLNTQISAINVSALKIYKNQNYMSKYVNIQTSALKIYKNKNFMSKYLNTNSKVGRLNNYIIKTSAQKLFQTYNSVTE